jgi:hypothetical protein
MWRCGEAIKKLSSVIEVAIMKINLAQGQSPKIEWINKTAQAVLFPNK